MKRWIRPSWLHGSHKLLALTVLVLLTCKSAISSPCDTASFISSNFNGTPISGGRYIWFNSHLKLSGKNGSPAVVNLYNAYITFSSNGINYSLAVPKTQVVFSSSVATPTTSFDNASQTWLVQVPYSQGGDVFSGGLAFPVPAGGLPGGINPVKWSASFSANTANMKVDWQWSAAVYTNFSTDNNALGVLPVDGGGQSGTPVNFKNSVVGGARGGGGANATGSNSGTESLHPCTATAPSLKLGNLIWNDLNLNNVRDANEPGIANATVKLYKDDNNDDVADGAAIATTITDANGIYSFSNLDAGNYIVGVLIPFGNVRGPISIIDPDNDVDNDNNGTTLIGDNIPGSEVRSKAIKLAPGAEPTNDGDDNNGNMTLDIALCQGAPPPPPTGGGAQCFGISNAGCTSCNLRYPDNSNLPRSSVVFNESDVLRYAEPGPSTCGNATSQIKVYYNDEHAITLGVRKVIVKTASGTTSTDYPVTPTPSVAECVSNPLVGTTAMDGAQSGNDVSLGGGRPLWPALFITDLTVNGSLSRAGDWQQGGTGIPPHKICGTWKAAVRTVDSTKSPVLVSVTPDADPTKNNWILGSGSDVPDTGFAALGNEGYGAEVVWDVAQLGLIPGHTYRLQFMVHDGDQNKAGGDAGEQCTTVVMGGTPNTSSDGTVKAVWTVNADNTVTIKSTIDKSVVDNTYGTNAIGYPSTHKFADMTATDNMQMELYDANGVKKMDITMDYLSASSTAPSGYKTLGVAGGDGSISMGNATDVVSVKTSLDSNLNGRGYVLTTNSPATNSNYTPNASYPNWDFNVSYETKVSLAPFGTAGFGYPRVVKVNASPNKLGSNVLTLSPSDCPGSLRLGNQIWNDYDGDGKRDDNEPGIKNVVVSLYTDNDNDNVPDGAAIRTTVSDVLGHYLFTNLAPGRYIVSIPVLDGYQKSPNNSTQGTSFNPDNNKDNDNNLVRLVGPNGPGGVLYTNNINLTVEGEPTDDGDDSNGNLTMDLAECGNGFIGDFVWYDANGNGLQDANEGGMNGVTVMIQFEDGRTATTTTQSWVSPNNSNAPVYDGYYNFPRLGPGTYKISFAASSMFSPTLANKGGNDTQDSDPINGNPVTVVLGANETNFSVDAGFIHNSTFSVARTGVVTDEVKGKAINYDFQVYPNPSAYYFNVLFKAICKGTAAISVSDATGRIYINEKKAVQVGDNLFNINASRLAEGVYNVEIKLDGHLLHKRVMVAK